jgi:hypothetical protein
MLLLQERSIHPDDVAPALEKIALPLYQAEIEAAFPYGCLPAE